MGVEENDDRPIYPSEVQPEIPEQEPIEQVFSQEPEDARTLEPSIESEDEVRFEETAKFEEDIDTPKVEPKPVRKQARKSKVKRKSPTRDVNENKPVSKLHDELKKHSEARKKAEREILDIRKELKDVLLAHHATIKDLQKQVAQMHRKITTIDSSKKSKRGKTATKKKVSGKKTKNSIRRHQVRNQKRRAVRRRAGNVSQRFIIRLTPFYLTFRSYVISAE